MDICGSAKLHHIRGWMLLISLSYIFFSSTESLACAAVTFSYAPWCRVACTYCFGACCCLYACTVVQFLQDVCSRVWSWRKAELLGRNAKGFPHFSCKWRQELKLCLVAICTGICGAMVRLESDDNYDIFSRISFYFTFYTLQDNLIETGFGFFISQQTGVA